MNKFKIIYFYIISTTIIFIMSVILLNLFMIDKTGIPAEASTQRFVCIYSGGSDNFKASLKEGLENAAKENTIWIKFVGLKSYELDKHCTELDKAIVSKVDGIITNVPDNNLIKPYIEAANASGIPVITIENDLPNCGRVSFIGTNGYAFGVSAGKLMSKAIKQKAVIANFSDSNIDRYDLKNQGFKDTLEENMEIEFFTVNEPSVIEYTNKAQLIFMEDTEINSFFCPDTESTTGIVRAMIEFNKTDFTVIGSGDSIEILNFIKNGLVYASLVEDPFSIGYFSVDSMMKYLNGENVSDSINPEIIVITKDNVDQIIDERKVGR